MSMKKTVEELHKAENNKISTIPPPGNLPEVTVPFTFDASNYQLRHCDTLETRMKGYINAYSRFDKLNLFNALNVVFSGDMSLDEIDQCIKYNSLSTS